ncbi:MAG: 4Fe-4S binding protein, partial [Coriobacteriales bacterium]|nr:4Fe-4S binding protein [Coriobacteriales bacterium]
MGKLSTYAQLFEVLSKQGFAVEPRSCVCVRNRNVRCVRCAQACTTGCISVSEQGIEIDTQRCIGCGSCATACPTDALRRTQPDDREILDEMLSVMELNEGHVVLACATVLENMQVTLDPDRVVGVACLGRVDESLLAAIAAEGALDFTLINGGCAACAHSKGMSTIQQVMASAESLFEAWGVRCAISLTQEPPAICVADGKPDYDPGKREFLKSMRDLVTSSGKEAAAYLLDTGFGQQQEPPAYQHVSADGTLPHFMSTRRALLMDSLDILGEPHEGAVVRSRLWKRVRVNADACNGCGMCAVFCPTAALAKRVEIDEAASSRPVKLYRAPGNPRAAQTTQVTRPVAARHSGSSASSSFATGERVDLMHAPSLCVGCGTCLQVCRQKAISLEADVPA